jgi:hypothetical protein
MWEGEFADESRASTSVVAGDGGVMRRYLDKGNAVAPIIDPLVLRGGGEEDPRSGFSISDDGGTFGVALPLGGIVFGAAAG